MGEGSHARDCFNSYQPCSTSYCGVFPGYLKGGTYRQLGAAVLTEACHISQVYGLNVPRLDVKS